MRSVRARDGLAQGLGQKLGIRKVLLGGLSQRSKGAREQNLMRHQGLIAAPRLLLKDLGSLLE